MQEIKLNTSEQKIHEKKKMKTKIKKTQGKINKSKQSKSNSQIRLDRISNRREKKR